MGKEISTGRVEFDRYPAPLAQVADYTRRHSRTKTVRGHHLSKAAIRLLHPLVLHLSWQTAYRIGAWIGQLLYLFRVRRHVAMTNLDIVFGASKSAAEKDRIYRASLINCGRVVVNYFRLPYQNEQFWRENCRFKNEAIFKAAMNRKKGALLIAGHIGMMDIPGGKIGMSGYPVALVGKKIKHPVLDKFLLDTRLAMNVGTIKHRGSMKRVLKGIRSGEAVAMALDQNMKKSVGVFLDWMGRPACSVRSAAYVAYKTGAPVVTGFMHQTGPDRFELVVTEELEWETCPGNPEKEILVNAQKQADAIQKIICAHPELWFWIHQRWKTQPDGVGNPYE